MVAQVSELLVEKKALMQLLTDIQCLGLRVQEQNRQESVAVFRILVYILVYLWFHRDTLFVVLLILCLLQRASLQELVFLFKLLQAIEIDQQFLVFLQAQRLVISSFLLTQIRVILSVVDSQVSARASVKALALAKKGDLRAIQTLVLSSSFPTLFLGAHNLKS